MNRPLMTLLTLSTVLLATPLYSQEHEHREHGAHVHGVATLSIAMDQGAVEVQLESPAMNLLGFEHEPENKEQQQLLEKTLKQLADASQLFTFTGGNCQQSSANVESPFEKEHHDEHHQEGKAGKEEHEHDDEHEHSDFDLSYQFRCDNAAAVQGVEITAFRHFSGFDKIQVQWVNAAGQGTQEANKGSYHIKFQ